jgi:hypothetical protein
MESAFLFAAVVLLIGTVIFLEVWHSKERRNLLDRIQAHSFADFKFNERKDAGKEPKKIPPDPIRYD